MFASMKRKALSFSSGRVADKARAFLPLVGGVLLCGIALTAAGRRISAVEKEIRKEAKPVEVVVASVSIPVGETFSERNLAKKAVPSSGTGKRNVPASEFELLLGARAKTPVEPGEPVLWTDVEEPYDTDSLSRLVLPGRRALTLGVDTTSSFAGMLHPGDRVDLLLEGPGGGSEWVRGVPVIAVDQHRNPLANAAGESDTATVTVMVTPGEGTRIARASGKVHWFLRNPDDNTVAVAAGEGKPPSPAAVEIWQAGIKVRTTASGRETRE